MEARAASCRVLKVPSREEDSGMASKKKAFTTGQVADICSVSPQTVIKWFDSGKLKGYKLPGSKDRRIPVENLLQFMKDHDIPVDDKFFS